MPQFGRTKHWATTLIDKFQNVIYLVSERSLNKMFKATVKAVFWLILAAGFFPGCAEIKETGRTIGHTTRDVTTEIGHGARDLTREIGHGTRDVIHQVGEGTRDATKAAGEEVKKVVKPAPATPAPSEY
jgi:hypothetical protein